MSSPSRVITARPPSTFRTSTRLRERIANADAHHAIDLDARQPVISLCAPVAAEHADAYPVGNAVVLIGATSIKLQRCGSRHVAVLAHRLSGLNVAVGRSFVVWKLGNTLHGVFLPNGGSFTERLPKGIYALDSISVNDAATYIQANVGGYEKVWRGANP